MLRWEVLYGYCQTNISCQSPWRRDQSCNTNAFTVAMVLKTLSLATPKQSAVPARGQGNVMRLGACTVGAYHDAKEMWREQDPFGSLRAERYPVCCKPKAMMSLTVSVSCLNITTLGTRSLMHGSLGDNHDLNSNNSYPEHKSTNKANSFIKYEQKA